jgi:hypothetical protein
VGVPRLLDRAAHGVVNGGLPRRGEFGHQCVVGAYAPGADDAVRTSTRHGLVLETASYEGTLRDADGVLITLRRTFGWDWSQPLVLRAGVGARLAVDRGILGRAWSGSGLTDMVREGVHQYRGGAGTMVLDRAVDAVEWTEAGVASLTGARVGPGLQWHDPTPPGSAYASVFYRARGVVLDRAVEGFVIASLRYLPSGVLWGDMPYVNGPHLQRAWVTFASEWADGTTELGHLCAGEASWGFAVAADGTALTALTTDVTAVIDDAAVTFAAAGEAWAWQRNALLDPAAPYESGTAAEGLVRRAGEGRTPRVWCARLHPA